MYSRQHRTSKSNSNDSETPASNQFAPRPFVVQPQVAEPTTQQNQTADLQAKEGKTKEVSDGFPDPSVFTRHTAPPKQPRIQMKLTIGKPNELTSHELTHEVQQGDGVQMRQMGENSTLQTKESTENDDHKRIAGDITGVFEGGKPGSVQTVDSGIVSYGKHQATIASGSLYLILKAYTESSKTSTAAKVAEYLAQVQKKDETLRKDEAFHNLLKDAAKDPEMVRAQDDVFSQKYWKPARQTAEKAGIKSALGETIFYDTKIQGGLEAVLESTKQRLKDKKYTEQEFLGIFLEEREKRLYAIAKQKRAKGDEKTAKMLENSAKNRVGALDALVKSGNLDLIGDEKGQIKIGGRKITALGKGSTTSNNASAANPSSNQAATSSQPAKATQSATSSQPAKATQSATSSQPAKATAEKSQVGFKPSDPKGHIAKLHPGLQAKVQTLIENAHKKGLNVWIVQGLRTIEEQNELYAQGRTKGEKGKTVTNARGGKSYHNYGLAVDVVFHGSQPYGEGNDWKALGEAGKEAGLEWGGDWKSFKDRPHFQMPGLKISQLQAWYASGGMKNVWKNVTN
ncbi:peptidoglycan L-alanyl-D-glutamate endopeptidase CwlK [Cylindrospermum sp. NIES-4074]|nr:peptidoglycan L-alanyl-D-glutamate endopeptidase CwlK [Cylindrospermum sp. NIES-4074]